MRDHMNTKTRQFPEGFYWGAATASYQVEGGIENCDWAQAAREGKVPKCGRACDHYNRYEEDFDIAVDLGHNCHRISIEWARVEPEEGRFDDAEIEHYRVVLAALRARRLKPFITLWHFTLPQWFADKGGFENPDAPKLFARYCAYVTKKLGNDCRHFSTMNEPLVFASNGWRRGSWPPFKKWPLIDRLKYIPGHRPSDENVSIGNVFRYFYIVRQLVRAHNRAYTAMKAAAFGVEVGLVHQVILFHHDGKLRNRVLAALMNWHWTHSFIRRIYQHSDSIGVNYYLHKKFGDTATYEKTDMGWDVYPEGLCNSLLMLKKYNLPLWVSEAGIADSADRMRGDYIRRLIRCMHVALEKGADVRGYMYWSLLDNYEWAQGFEKRFGLVEVDFDTLERKIRPSAYVYKEIIDRNALVE
jgi:beta-glucosidase